MCEYLSGCLTSNRSTDGAVLQALREEALRSGYSVQLNDELPPKIRREITSIVPEDARAALINITSDAKSDCIEEVLGRELYYETKKPFEEVALFHFIRRIFSLCQVEKATLIYTEGAMQGWSFHKKYQTSLEELLQLLYEHYNRRDRDIRGIYKINWSIKIGRSVD